jgi:asparagine synthase (glutamine-hydrolysing)
MCGFTGIIAKSKVHPKTSSFMKYAMGDLIRRGPDEQKIWVSDDNTIHFGFARLAIRDLTKAGSQPMLSSDGRWVLMYNGETYNTKEVVTWSGLDEHSLKSSSDSEVILKAIELKGVHETISMLDGIFAMAIMDTNHHKLYLVRDHLGIKPLYFGANEEGIVFSSHYHHVIKHPYFQSNAINPGALSGYFKYGFIQPGEGLYEKTYLMPQGHIAEFLLQSGTFNYQPFSFKGTIDYGDLKHTIQHVVQSQLVSDVPVGTFLSGGVDSGLTTAFASMAKKDLTAYTVSVDDPNLDEAEQSKIIAQEYQVHHQIHKILSNELHLVINQYDESLAEPLADYSSLLTLKVCEIAKQTLTVVLSGDGGDELFFGYSRMNTFWKYLPFLKMPLLKRFFTITMQRLKGIKIPYRLLKFNDASDYYLSAQGLTGNKEWLKRILKNGRDSRETFIEKTISNACNTDLEKWVKQIELNIHLQRVLLKVDRASMYHSLEVRTPLLSPVMVAQAEKYVYTDCVQDGIGKMPLRNLLQQLTENQSLAKSKKKGFEPPMPHWMRSDLKDRIGNVVLNVPDSLQSYINSDEVVKMWQDHQSGKDYSWPLWALYSLFTWEKKLAYNKNEG